MDEGTLLSEDCLARLDQIDTIISDKDAPKDILKQIKKQPVKVVLV